jgi:hypothetical protein
MTPTEKKPTKDLVLYTTDPKTHKFTGSLPLGGKEVSTPALNKIAKKVSVTEPIVLLNTTKRMLTIYPDGEVLETVYSNPRDPRFVATIVPGPVTSPASRLTRVRYWMRIAKANRSFHLYTKTTAVKASGVDLAWEKYNEVEDEYTKKNKEIAKLVGDIEECKRIKQDADNIANGIIEEKRLWWQAKADEAGATKVKAWRRVNNPSMEDAFNIVELYLEAEKATMFEKMLVEKANESMVEVQKQVWTFQQKPYQVLAHLEAKLAELTGEPTETIKKLPSAGSTILEPTDS